MRGRGVSWLWFVWLRLAAVPEWGWLYFLVEVLAEFVLYEVSDEDSVAVFVYGVHDGVG